MIEYNRAFAKFESIKLPANSFKGAALQVEFKVGFPSFDV